jgi:hypothetical protein
MWHRHDSALAPLNHSEAEMIVMISNLDRDPQKIEGHED